MKPVFEHTHLTSLRIIHKLVRRALPAACLFVGFALRAVSQTPGISDVSVAIHRIPIPQIHSFTQVNAFAQDRSGYIWMGTSTGLNRYDGQNCILFEHNPLDSNSLSDNWILSLFADTSGMIWVGTARGLNRFDPTTAAWTRFVYDPENDASVSHDRINTICEDRAGVLWVGTSRGLNRFERDRGTFKRYFPSQDDSSRPGENSIKVVLEDREGILWIGTGEFRSRGGGLFTFDRRREKFSRFRNHRSDPVDLSDDRITSLFEDGSGSLWLSTSPGGVARIDKRSGTLTRLSLSGPGATNMPTPGIEAVCEDKAGAIWMATYTSGLFRYDRQTGTVRRFTSNSTNPSSLSNPSARTLFLDRAGLLWVGLEGAVNTVTTSPFLHRHILGDSLRIESRAGGLFVDREGMIWIQPANAGLWRFDPRTQKARLILANVHVGPYLQDSSGSIWIGGFADVLKFDPATSRLAVVWSLPRRHGGLEMISSTMLLDSDGFLWVGTNEGSLYRIEKSLRQYTLFVHDAQDPGSITPGWITSVVEDRSRNIWVGTYDGLNRFDRKTQSFTRFTHDEGDTSTLSHSRVLEIHEQQCGTLWVGTEDGLNRWNSSTSTFSRFLSAGRQVIGRIMEDRKGNLWYATHVGISKFEPSTGSFRMFDQSDGLEDVDVIVWSRASLPSGEFLFGTTTGLLVFHPDSVHPLAYAPPIVITGVRKLNQPVVPGNPTRSLPEITLKHDENVFSIEFQALSYDMPGFNSYAYRLEGFDKDWVYCGNKREATYTNLDPGVYTFCVKGSNHDGIWNEAGASIGVIVRPALWQTWWFRSLTIALLMGLVAMVYHREVSRLRREKMLQQEFSRRQIESQEAERKRVAAELHDGLGQDLLIMNNELQLFLKANAEPHKELEQVASILHESIEGVREIASNLHPHHLDRLGLSAAVQAMVERVTLTSGVAIRRTGDSIDGLLPRDAEMHLYRIIQEALSNAVRHASARNISIRFTRNATFVEVIISDDGSGFDMKDSPVKGPSQATEVQARGFGLSSMAERARIMGGTLRIESSQGSGTTIHVTVPYS